MSFWRWCNGPGGHIHLLVSFYLPFILACVDPLSLIDFGIAIFRHKRVLLKISHFSLLLNKKNVNKTKKAGIIDFIAFLQLFMTFPSNVKNTFYDIEIIAKIHSHCCSNKRTAMCTMLFILTNKGRKAPIFMLFSFKYLFFL